MSTDGKRWYQELNGYHWFVLFVASLGWLFDCLDQHLFNLSRPSAMRALLASPTATARPQADQRIRRLRHVDLSDRLGHRRPAVRRAGRSDRPGQDDALDHPVYSLFTGLSTSRSAFGILPSIAFSRGWAWEASSRWAWPWWPR